MDQATALTPRTRKLRDVTNSSQHGSPLRHSTPAKSIAGASGALGKGDRAATPASARRRRTILAAEDLVRALSTATAAAATPPPPAPSGSRLFPAQAMLSSSPRTPAVVVAKAEEDEVVRPSPNTRINNIRERMAGLTSVRKAPQIWVWLRVVTPPLPYPRHRPPTHSLPPRRRYFCCLPK